MISKEDYQGNILPAILRHFPMEGKTVVEFGAGTGRLTRLLAPKADFIHAFDSYPAMLEQARRRLSALRIKNVSLARAENNAIPARDATADLTIAGWTFGHCVSWFPTKWEMEISSAVREMFRLTRKSGAAVILETLGTGHESPIEPTEGLSRYYAYLENECGFARHWIRTDYRFDSTAQANALTSAFFGKTFPLKCLPDGSAVLPECTGLWHRRF
ncbi:MAG: class I SAM-dependent methyltransferase [Oligoflexia bacterium]|nr:class I SAM-dependent methyltransferase [Oligoflexia bacterium]